MEMVRENEKVVQVDDLSLVLRKDAGFLYFLIPALVCNSHVCLIRFLSLCLRINFVIVTTIPYQRQIMYSVQRLIPV